MASKRNILFILLLSGFCLTNWLIRGPFFDAETNLPKKKAPYSIPNATVLQALSLNYQTFVSDMMWIGSTVSYGEQLRDKRTNPVIMENAYNLVRLDPHFRRLYDWFPAVALNAYRPISHELLMKIDGLMGIGINAMPSDPNLAFAAGMNFIGYSVKRSPEERLLEYQQGAKRLGQALRSPNAPFMTYATKLHMETKIAGLNGVELDRNQEIELLAQLFFLAESEGKRNAYQAQITSLGGDQSDVIEATQKIENRQNEFRRNSLPYFDVPALRAINP